tara:strand:+ start:42 stop:449 length:408 start_codon:yes stop_codon:yes gene_type:complete
MPIEGLLKVAWRRPGAVRSSTLECAGETQLKGRGSFLFFLAVWDCCPHKGSAEIRITTDFINKEDFIQKDAISGRGPLPRFIKEVHNHISQLCALRQGGQTGCLGAINFTVCTQFLTKLMNDSGVFRMVYTIFWT